MKKLLLYTLLPIVASILNLSKATSQGIPLPVLNRVYITPENPTPTDSIIITFDYVSDDSCPDYYLVTDSVVANKIYVSKKSIDNSKVICAQIVTKFTTTLNLGPLNENTQIYIDGVLTKTISYLVIPPVQNNVYITPSNPGPTDSVTVSYIYVSGDSCPDYYLVKDSVVANNIYVSKKNIIPNPRVACAQIVTKFTTTLHLGMLEENAQIYFDGVLIKTINYPCTMDKNGVIVAGTGGCTGHLFIEEKTIASPAIPRLYTLPNTTVISGNGTQPGLMPGQIVKFSGYEILTYPYANDPCPVFGMATCYEVIAPPPSGCMMDKKGIVVTGEGACAGQLFIQEYSPVNLAKQLYIINRGDSINSSGAVTTVLKNGDQVLFGGYLTKNDSSLTNHCYTVGVATCYQVITTPPACVMNNVGTVLEFKDNSSLIKADSTSDIYAIRNVALPIGTRIQFKGEKIECITTPCYNIIECYQIIGTPPCVMDKKGIVVTGTDGCAGRIFIQDTSSPNTNPQLYALRDSATVNGNNPVALKSGDIVMFGDSLTINTTGLTSLCNTVGVVTCYQVISTLPDCVMDKTGVVVTGTNACTGQLFIEESTPYMSIIPRLYRIKNDTLLKAGNPAQLKAGDQVKFGGYLTPNDSSVMNSCHIIGVATCYELVQPENVDTLMGTVNAGNAIAETGLAILYKKGDTKATATYTITNGSYLFTNLPKADYTVYIIPDINAYKNYLPTFYKNNFLFQNADYITLAGTMMNITVDLKSYVFPVGTGKIYGNIFFETYTLKDSLLVDSIQYNTGSLVINSSAINTPVILLNSNGEPVAWTLTDLYGNYTFENIALDTYKILSETASAEGDCSVNLSPYNSIVNTDLMLKGLQSYTGINNPKNVVINLYPNPVSDNLIIILSEAENVSIYNVMGQMILNKRLTQGINVLDLSSMNKDIYFARIGGTTVKLIKK